MYSNSNPDAFLFLSVRIRSKSYLQKGAPGYHTRNVPGSLSQAFHEKLRVQHVTVSFLSKTILCILHLLKGDDIHHSVKVPYPTGPCFREKKVDMRPSRSIEKGSFPVRVQESIIGLDGYWTPTTLSPHHTHLGHRSKYHISIKVFHNLVVLPPDTPLYMLSRHEFLREGKSSSRGDSHK